MHIAIIHLTIAYLIPMPYVHTLCSIADYITITIFDVTIWTTRSTVR